MIQPYSDHTKLIQAAGANQRMSAARWSRSNSLVSAFQIFQRPKRPVDLDLSLRKARFHIFHLRAAMVSEGAEVCVAAYDYATSTTLQFGEVYSPMLNPSVDICYKSLWCSQPWWWALMMFDHAISPKLVITSKQRAQVQVSQFLKCLEHGPKSPSTSKVWKKHPKHWLKIQVRRLTMGYTKQIQKSPKYVSFLKTLMISSGFWSTWFSLPSATMCHDVPRCATS